MSDTRRRKALITGVSGQDGAYLARFLFFRGYAVVGTSRGSESTSFVNLARLGIREHVHLHTLDLQSASAVKQHLDSHSYDEVYHLAGESSVGQSYSQPRQTILETQVATLNILEAARSRGGKTRYFFAGSSECFGETNGRPADEATPFSPLSPYAIAKAACYRQVVLYREVYGIPCCTGILFNHESAFRSDRFVLGKILASARRIAEGSQDLLELGDLSVERDWGWAPEYVEAMWLMLNTQRVEDYIIATGYRYKLVEMLDWIFSSLNLRWQDYVVSRNSLKRTQDIKICAADPSKINRQLGWRPMTHGRNLAAKLAYNII